MERPPSALESSCAASEAADGPENSQLPSLVPRFPEKVAQLRGDGRSMSDRFAVARNKLRAPPLYHKELLSFYHCAGGFFINAANSSAERPPSLLVSTALN
jgi:hypothetical protein